MQFLISPDQRSGFCSRRISRTAALKKQIDPMTWIYFSFAIRYVVFYHYNCDTPSVRLLLEMTSLERFDYNPNVSLQELLNGGVC